MMFLGSRIMLGIAGAIMLGATLMRFRSTLRALRPCGL
jgi:hypothetical protein